MLEELAEDKRVANRQFVVAMKPEEFLDEVTTVDKRLRRVLADFAVKKPPRSPRFQFRERKRVWERNRAMDFGALMA